MNYSRAMLAPTERWSRGDGGRACKAAPGRRRRVAAGGTDAVASAAPNGSTLGLSIGGPLAINPLLFSRLPYDPQADLALITVVATQPSALAVNADLAVASGAELIEALERKPDGYNFGSI